MLIDYSSLIEIAFEAREKSVSTYSGFAVGAALLCADGEVFTGCNIESSVFSNTMCAERVALFKAVSEGQKDFVGIAIVGGREEDDYLDVCPPCGICRQALAEFCTSPDFEIILAKSAIDYQVYRIEEILPIAFTGKML